MNITLIESQRKRCSFLETVIVELDLKGTRVLNQRAEKIMLPDHRRIGAVIFRAVSDINNCLKLAEPFLKTGGKVILTKDLKKIDIKDPFLDRFSLQRESVVFGYKNKKSSLLVFEKCIA